MSGPVSTGQLSTTRLAVAFKCEIGDSDLVLRPIGSGRGSPLAMNGVRHRVAGSLRSEAATAGDAAAAPPASSKAPAVAGEVPREVPSSKCPVLASPSQKGFSSTDPLGYPSPVPVVGHLMGNLM